MELSLFSPFYNQRENKILSSSTLAEKKREKKNKEKNMRFPNVINF